MTEQTLHYIVHLSGPPQVVAAGVVIHGFESEKTLALLAYLALVERPVNREHLAGLFWGERDAERSRGNLRRVLHNLTHLLPGCLEVDRHSVRFVAEQATVDVRVFRQQSAADDLAALLAAMNGCGGELLEGLALADCPEFELWLVGERERWRAQVLTASETLITAYIRQGEYAIALTLLDQALALAPWLEHLHRQKMLLLARGGQFSAALKQYDLCRRLLAEEMGLPPSHELETLRARIEAARQRPRRTISPPTQLVGRKQELAALSALLLDPAHRLITITGPGGVGKSALAQAVAAEVSFAFLDGVLYASLLSIAHPRELPDLLLQQLGLSTDGRPATAEQLVAALHRHELLLVLDNCEHVLTEANEATWLLCRILEGAPAVRLLIASRQRLALRAESVLPLQGLSPDADGAPALFQQRLTQYNPTWVCTPAETAAIDQICAALGGSPLGIELAAAQSGWSGCIATAAHLQQSLDALHGDLHDLPERQRSLRALFDSSWRLLSPAEQHSLAQLALFGSDFSAGAAHAIADADATQIGRLIDKSLLRAIPPDRYTFHPLVREFANAHLTAHPAQLDAVKTKFSRYYLAWLAERNLATAPSRQRTIMAELGAEWPHVCAAWRFFAEAKPAIAGDQAHFLAALDALYHFCMAHSLFCEGRALLTAVYTARSAPVPLLHSAIGVRLAIFHLRLGEPEQARRLLEDHLPVLHVLTPLPTATVALGTLNLATVALHQDRYAEVQRLSEESRLLYQQTGDRWGEAMALNVAGVGEFNRARYDQAQRLYGAALAIFEALGDARWVAKVLHNLATSYDLTGDHGRALEHFTTALAIHRNDGEQWSEGLARNSIGFVQINLGLYAAAAEELQQAGQIFANLGAPWGEMMVLANRCLLDYLRDDLAAAEQHGRQAHDLAQKLGDRRYLAYAAHRLGNVLAAQGRWDEAIIRYQEALAIRCALGQTNLALESQAALAWVAWQGGDLAMARQTVTSILPVGAAAPTGMDEPLRFYLACYAVLAPLNDPGAAALLQRAAALLQRRAEHIPNAEWRTAYQQVAAHQTIVRLAGRSWSPK